MESLKPRNKLEESLNTVFQLIDSENISGLQKLTWIEAEIKKCYYEMKSYINSSYHDEEWSIDIDLWKDDYKNITSILKQIALKVIWDFFGEEPTAEEVKKYIIEASQNIAWVIE